METMHTAASTTPALPRPLRNGRFISLMSSSPFFERTLRCRSEVNLRGRQVLNILPNDPQLAVRQLEEFRRSSVRRTTSLGWTEPGADGLSHTRLEILARGAVPFQSVGGDHFQVPGHHRAAGFLHIHVEIRVRILPIESRKQASQIRAPVFVELHGESVVRKPGSRCDSQTKSRNQNATKLASHRDVPPVNGFATSSILDNMERPTSALQGAGYAARGPLNAEPHTK